MADTAGDADLADFEFTFRGVRYNEYTTPELLERVGKFVFRSDDVIIITYPRTGTTLTQEIVWEVLNHEAVEKDAEFAAIFDRFRFLEYHTKFNRDSPARPLPIDLLEAQPSGARRLIKTHLPYGLLRAQLEAARPKVIIVLRNPKDTAVAFFHFSRTLFGDRWTREWPDFLRLFMEGKTSTGDFFTNVLEWWALRDRPNVLLLRYEDILASKHQQVRAVAGFLGCSLPPEKVDVIAHNTDFTTMSRNPNVNVTIGALRQPFLRRGVAGGWRETFTVAQSEAMDRVIERRLAGSGLTFLFS